MSVAPTTRLSPVATSVRGVTLHRLFLAEESRGNLTAGEFGKDVPFTPERFFTVFGVPSDVERGGHAHRRCHQFLVCMRGSVTVRIDDGVNVEEVLMSSPEVGLYLPPMTWGTQLDYSSDALLVVFASLAYDPDEYIRDYAEFKQAAARRAEL